MINLRIIFTHCSGVSIFKFEQVNADLGISMMTEHIQRPERVYS